MHCLRDYENYAKNNLDSSTWGFYSQGSEREETLRQNILCYKRYRLIPRMLRNSPSREFRVTVLGNEVSVPFGIAPTAYQRLAHPDGEVAASKAASEMGTIYTLSTVATSSLEEVAKNQTRKSPLWMQVYILKERRFTEQMIRRAEANGYKALVLTVDTPVIGLQLRTLRAELKLPPHLSVPNIADALPKDQGSKTCSTNSSLYSETLTWDDVDWIKRISRLPLVLKGIITVADAKEAVKHGVSAVWISNHGGRQLDCIDTPLDILPGIASALNGSGCEIYMDGGIRWGTDILKALALGANFVFIGRPALWGLAYAGQDGVRNVLEILKSELDKAMHLSGCQSIQDIGSHLIKRCHQSKI